MPNQRNNNHNRSIFERLMPLALAVYAAYEASKKFFTGRGEDVKYLKNEDPFCQRTSRLLMSQPHDKSLIFPNRANSIPEQSIFNHSAYV